MFSLLSCLSQATNPCTSATKVPYAATNFQGQPKLAVLKDVSNTLQVHKFLLIFLKPWNCGFCLVNFHL